MEKLDLPLYIAIEYLNGIYCVRVTDSYILYTLSLFRFDEYYKLVGYDVENYLKVTRDKIEDCFSELKYRINSIHELLSRVLEKRKATECIAESDEYAKTYLQRSLYA